MSETEKWFIDMIYVSLLWSDNRCPATEPIIKIMFDHDYQ
jgi:hypothetical protein